MPTSKLYPINKEANWLEKPRESEQLLGPKPGFVVFIGAFKDQIIDSYIRIIETLNKEA